MVHGGDEAPLVFGGKIALGGVLSDLTVIAPHGVYKVAQDCGADVTPVEFKDINDILR